MASLSVDLTDVNIHLFAGNFSRAIRDQRWDFEDIKTKNFREETTICCNKCHEMDVERRKNYTFEALMHIDVEKEHDIMSMEIILCPSFPVAFGFHNTFQFKSKSYKLGANRALYC